MLRKITLLALPLLLLPVVSPANTLVPVSAEDLVIIEEVHNVTGAEAPSKETENRRYGGHRGGHHGGYGGHHGGYGGHHGGYGGNHGGYGGHHGGHH